VVIPTRRSTAEAFQVLFSHALGAAGSPYLIGVISDWLNPAPSPHADVNDALASNTTLITTTLLPSQNEPAGDPVANFKSLQYAIFVTCFVELLGGLAFLMTAWYIIDDKSKYARVVAASASGESIDSPDNT
jgi:hypothetical protein